ncbi:hypothetical protein HII31_13045 [Pseudocercospora fuligena]|uniref:Ubiquitin-like domain-containing protein n=1 Tax=Pseudocercospora fuligena TaxID=685502 RepID=A0A8H6VAY5_9PEZI|nr:hypothetical protein HII31_13045 [Pseudocercospora fuligena]
MAHPPSRQDVLAEATRSFQPSEGPRHNTEILALQDQLHRIEEEKSALIEELRAAKKSARRALTDSEQLTSQLSELEFKLADQRSRCRDLEQENTRAWALVDTERWKRQAGEQAIQDQRHEHDAIQKHAEDQSCRIKELEQEVVEQLKVRKDLEESSAKAYAAVTQETAWRKQAEKQLAQDRIARSVPEAKITSLERGLADKDAAIKTEQDTRRKVEQELTDAMRVLEHTEKARKALVEDVEKLKPLPDSLKPPIRFKDAVGRRFSFPWHLCKTWRGMEELIKQSFLMVDDPIRRYVNEGKYDLTGPDGEIVLPPVWEKIIQPDWSVTMHLWPAEENNKAETDESLCANLGFEYKEHSTSKAETKRTPPHSSLHSIPLDALTALDVNAKKSSRTDKPRSIQRRSRPNQTSPLADWFLGGSGSANKPRDSR